MSIWAQIIAIVNAVVRVWSEYYATSEREKTKEDGARSEQGVAASAAYKKLSDAVAARRRAERMLADVEQLRAPDADQRTD